MEVVEEDETGGGGDAGRWGARARLGTGGVGRSLKLLSDNEPSLGVPGTWVLALRPPRAIFVQSLLRKGGRQTKGWGDGDGIVRGFGHLNESPKD